MIAGIIWIQDNKILFCLDFNDDKLSYALRLIMFDLSQLTEREQ